MSIASSKLYNPGTNPIPVRHTVEPDVMSDDTGSSYVSHGAMSQTHRNDHSNAVSYSIIQDHMKDGAFIIALQAMVKEAKGVDVVEASVMELIVQNSQVFGMKATKLGEKEEYRANLIITNGCVSNFRMVVMGFSIGKSVTRSHFVSAILEDALLPIWNHGTIALVKGFSPVLLYQIGEEVLSVPHPQPFWLESNSAMAPLRVTQC